MSDGIVSPDRIPADIKTEIDELFPGSEGRRRIAYTLMFWNRKPSTKEQEDLSKWAGFKGGSSTYKVLRKLKEIGLFTDKVGSVPLSRSLLDLEVEQQRERMKTLPEPSVPSLPLPISAEETQETLSVSPKEDSEIPTENRDLPPKSPRTSAEIDMETRLKSAEGQIKQLERTTAAGFEDMKKILTEVVNPLSGAPTADNPGHVPPPQIESPELEASPESDEDRINRIVDERLQERGAQDPFADLSKEQLLELARSQPREFESMVNPDGAVRTGRVESQAVTLRPMILFLTTYSQMLFNKAVHDGYFDGTLSDFANFTMESWFTDRGITLDWNQRRPARGRLG